MKMLYYMGIDVGTTGCKTVIFDQDGSEYGEAYREYPVICTMPHQAEQDAEQVFAMLIQTMSEASREMRLCRWTQIISFCIR